MAVSAQSLAKVLAETNDDATAALILQLELENEEFTFSPLQQVVAETDEATEELIHQLGIEDSQTNDHATLFPTTLGAGAVTGDQVRGRACGRRGGTSRGRWIWKQFSSWFQPIFGLAKSASNVPPPPAPAPPPTPRYNCNGGCGDTHPADGCARPPCGHHYCHGCITTLFSLATTDQTLYPPRCCGQHIPFDDVKDILRQDVAEQFAAKKPELDDPNPNYCHVPTCSAYLGQVNQAWTFATCPSCDELTCLSCKAAGHWDGCAENEALEQTKQLADSQGWKQCPGCQRIVELHLGCNHMTCLCRTQFCYVCTTPWKNCECPQFDDTRRWERAREIAERNGRGNVGAIAAGLRRHHECAANEHNYVFNHGAGVCEMCNEAMPVFTMRCVRCYSQICRRCGLNRT